MNPDFDRLLASGIGFGLLVLAYFAWRFGPLLSLALNGLTGLTGALRCPALQRSRSRAHRRMLVLGSADEHLRGACMGRTQVAGYRSRLVQSAPRIPEHDRGHVLVADLRSDPFGRCSQEVSGAATGRASFGTASALARREKVE